MRAGRQTFQPGKITPGKETATEKTRGLIHAFRSKEKVLIGAAVLGLAGGFVVHRVRVSLPEAPATPPVKVAMSRPATFQGRSGVASRSNREADDTQPPEQCPSQVGGSPISLHRSDVPPDDAKAHGNLDLALNYESQGDFAAAEQMYRSLLEESWSNAKAHAGLGRALTRRGELPEAEAHLQRAVLLEPRDTRSRLDLAAVQIWLLHYSSARRELQAVLDLDPGGANADGALTLLRLVDALDAPE